MGSISEVLRHKRNEIPQPDPRLPIPDAKIGIEVEMEGYPRARYLHRDNAVPVDGLDRLWLAKADGSLREGIECVTNGGLVGTQIFQAIDSVMDFAKRSNLRDGYPRAGIHIHVDCTDLNEAEDGKDLWRLMQAYLIAEPLLFSYAATLIPECGEYRRWTGYCDALADSKKDFASIAKVAINWNSLKADNVRLLLSDTSKYQAINIKPLIDLGTIEFRMLPTVFDAGVLKEWVRILLAIKLAAKTTLATPGYDLCQQFSKLGPEGLIAELFPSVADILLPHVNLESAWKGIDAIQIMEGYATHKGPSVGWNTPDNELFMNKIQAQVVKPAAPKLKKVVPRNRDGIPQPPPAPAQRDGLAEVRAQLARNVEEGIREIEAANQRAI
jgi:hypothetical protein